MRDLSCPDQKPPANQPSPLDRRITLAVACVVAVLVASVATQGLEALRPVPDATFAFRV